MGLPKGRTNNAKGRPKASKNKVTRDLQESIDLFLSSNWPKVLADLKQVSPRDRLTFYEKILRYKLPQLQSQDLNFDISQFTEAQLDQIVNKILINNGSKTN